MSLVWPVTNFGFLLQPKHKHTGYFKTVGVTMSVCISLALDFELDYELPKLKSIFNMIISHIGKPKCLKDLFVVRHIFTRTVAEVSQS